VQHEATAKLDAMANTLFLDALRLPDVSRLISEEEPEPVEVGVGAYTCCFDPLDGSSNIGVASVGSVLGVYANAPDASDEFQLTGRQLVAAAFTVYGLPTMLIVAAANRVDGFAYDPEDRSWRLVSPGIRAPHAQYISINWMYRDNWPACVVRGVDHASAGLRGRYSGSMVEDIFRVLMSGGVFLYPEDAAAPRGKLRMLYEICPIGFVMEAAGGSAMDGAIPVLDVPVTSPHQRGPLIAGDREAVLRYHTAYVLED
jgi:fructose-1,6-bisphosphatase I